MKPYWESTLTLQEAWDLSPCGVAVYGNPAMRDVIWVRGQPAPLRWVVDGYKSANVEPFRSRVGWSPIEEDTFVPRMTEA